MYIQHDCIIYGHAQGHGQGQGQITTQQIASSNHNQPLQTRDSDHGQPLQNASFDSATVKCKL